MPPRLDIGSPDRAQARPDASTLTPQPHPQLVHAQSKRATSNSRASPSPRCAPPCTRAGPLMTPFFTHTHERRPPRRRCPTRTSTGCSKTRLSPCAARSNTWPRRWCWCVMPPCRRTIIPQYCHAAVPPFRHSAIPPSCRTALLLYRLTGGPLTSSPPPPLPLPGDGPRAGRGRVGTGRAGV